MATSLRRKQIALHPLNDNQMSPGDRDVLRANLEANEGTYPPLIVRPLTPESRWYVEGGPQYQMLDGEQRLSVLSEMGFEGFQCEVWDWVTDEDSMRILLTMNTVRGRSNMEQRAALAREFQACFPGGQKGLDALVAEATEQWMALCRTQAEETASVEAAMQRQAASSPEATQPKTQVEPGETSPQPNTVPPKDPPKKEPETVWVKLPWPIPKELGEAIEEHAEAWFDKMGGRNKGGRYLEFLYALALTQYGMDCPKELRSEDPGDATQ